METEKITIETLKEITSKNQPTFDSVLRACELEAKAGKNEALFIDYFTPILIGELLSFGLKINQDRNQFGALVTCVSW